MKVKMVGKKSGALQIKYLPSGGTVLDIKTYIKELELKSKKKIDCILIDYLDLMMPKSKRVSPADLFYQRQVCVRRAKKYGRRKQSCNGHSVTVKQSGCRRNRV